MGKGPQEQTPEGWERVTKGQVQAGDSIYDHSADKFRDTDYWEKHAKERKIDKYIGRTTLVTMYVIRKIIPPVIEEPSVERLSHKDFLNEIESFKGKL